MTNKTTMPEPVSYAIFAENGNIRLWSTEPRDLPDLDSLGPMHHLITTDQAEAYANARVRRALEEAAMILKANAEACNIDTAIMLRANAEAILDLLSGNRFHL